jgi:hypothetical protein
MVQAIIGLEEAWELGRGYLEETTDVLKGWLDPEGCSDLSIQLGDRRSNKDCVVSL